VIAGGTESRRSQPAATFLAEICRIRVDRPTFLALHQVSPSAMFCSSEGRSVSKLQPKPEISHTAGQSVSEGVEAWDGTWFEAGSLAFSRAVSSSVSRSNVFALS
jgi:hypothetical protein